jgi:predicted dinucleotide-binding enzyme
VRIGIIGAGNMDATLAAQLTRLGHQVAIATSHGTQSPGEPRIRTRGPCVATSANLGSRHGAATAPGPTGDGPASRR